MAEERDAAYRSLSVKLRRDSGVLEYLDSLCAEIGVTVSGYTRQALISKLKRDGYLQADERSAQSLERAMDTYRGRKSRETDAAAGAIEQATVMGRVEAVARCIEMDERYAEAARACGVSYQQMYLWMKRYRESGVDGLEFTRGKRREGGRMTPEQRRDAQRRLMQAQQAREREKRCLQQALEQLEGRPR